LGVGRQQDVSGLQVAVDDAVLVQVLGQILRISLGRKLRTKLTRLN
jgi:hypothetical protein